VVEKVWNKRIAFLQVNECSHSPSAREAAKTQPKNNKHIFDLVHVGLLNLVPNEQLLKKSQSFSELVTNLPAHHRVILPNSI